MPTMEPPEEHNDDDTQPNGNLVLGAAAPAPSPAEQPETGTIELEEDRPQTGTA